MPQIAEIKEIDGEIWVRVGKAGKFDSGLAIMSPDEIEAQSREYSKAYDHGYADANKLAEERASEREPNETKYIPMLVEALQYILPLQDIYEEALADYENEDKGYVWQAFDKIKTALAQLPEEYRK